jgi:hypothetical protein
MHIRTNKADGDVLNVTDMNFVTEPGWCFEIVPRIIDKNALGNPKRQMPPEDYLRRSPVRFDDPKYQVCYEYWLSLKGARMAPSWRDWDWFRLPAEVIPYFLVVDVDYSPLTFTYRFWGTANVSMHNIDFTGKTTDAIRSPITARNTFDQYRKVAETGEAIGSAYTIQAGAEGPPYVQTSLRMPFSDDGKTVHQIATYADWSSDIKEIRKAHLEEFGRPAD